MSSAELSEWRAFDRLEPIGALGADFRSGLICSTMANIHRGPKNSKAFTPQDFMPFFKKQEQQPNALAQFRLWFGAKVSK